MAIIPWIRAWWRWLIVRTDSDCDSCRVYSLRKLGIDRIDDRVVEEIASCGSVVERRLHHVFLLSIFEAAFDYLRAMMTALDRVVDPVLDLVVDLHHVAVEEGTLEHDHFIEQDPEGPNIAVDSVPLAHADFRRKIQRSSNAYEGK